MGTTCSAQPLAAERQRLPWSQIGRKLTEGDTVAVDRGAERPLEDAQLLALGETVVSRRSNCRGVLRVSGVMRVTLPVSAKAARETVFTALTRQQLAVGGADEHDPAAGDDLRVDGIEIELGETSGWIGVEVELLPCPVGVRDDRAISFAVTLKQAGVGRVVAEERGALAQGVDRVPSCAARRCRLRRAEGGSAR